MVIQMESHPIEEPEAIIPMETVSNGGKAETIISMETVSSGSPTMLSSATTPTTRLCRKAA
jgi:hypothetical protein